MHAVFSSKQSKRSPRPIKRDKGAQKSTIGFYKYKASVSISQANLPNFSNFVNYVKMLCKYHYVNNINKELLFPCRVKM